MTVTPPESIAFPEGLRGEGLNRRLPTHRLRRTKQPTTRITGEVKRFDEREHGFFGSARGLRTGAAAGVPPLRRQVSALGGDEGRRASSGRCGRRSYRRGTRSPAGRPHGLSRHIKQTALFMRADESASAGCLPTRSTRPTRTATPSSWATPTPSPYWWTRAIRPSRPPAGGTGSATPRASAPIRPRL